MISVGSAWEGVGVAAGGGGVAEDDGVGAAVVERNARFATAGTIDLKRIGVVKIEGRKARRRAGSDMVVDERGEGRGSSRCVPHQKLMFRKFAKPLGFEKLE